MENSKYESALTCGFCKKQTQLSDELTEAVMNGKKSIVTICSCGHASYASKMRSRFKVNTRDWRMICGSSK